MNDEKNTRDETPPVGRSRFSKLHARTYEIELLLSGAVVLGLIQVPPVVSLFFDRFRSGLAGELRMVAVSGEAYVELMLYSVIATFLLHLTLRAFWIGLLGLESVYSGGIRWNRLKIGPNTLERYRRDVPPLAKAIERADDLCSLVFSFGSLIAITFIYSVVLLLVAAVSGFVVSRLALDGNHSSTVFWSVLGGVFGVQLLATLTDKLLGARVDPDGVVARVLGSLVKVGYVLSPMRWIGPVQLTLQSNLSANRVSFTVIASMFVLMAVFVGLRFVGEGVLRFDSRGYFPVSLREHGLDPRHYRDRRDPGRVDPRYPSIQAEVVEGAFAELSIPYYPKRHNLLIADACPELEPLRAEGVVFDDDSEPTAEEVRRTAACIGSLFEVTLDGGKLDALPYEFTIEPGSEIEALAAFLDVRDLAPGRHELLVQVPGRPDDGPSETVRHVIPFWR